MTLKRLLAEIGQAAKEDQALGRKATLEDLLDFAAIAGLEGASEAYIKLFIK